MTTITPTPSREVLLEDINIEVSARVRVEDCEDVVVEFCDAYARNEQLPWPHLFDCGGDKLLVADGRHRLKAAERAEMKKLTCYVHSGTAQDCQDFAVGCNSKHGLRRTNADKRLCVELTVRSHPDWSNRRIAGQVHVTDPFVAQCRMVLTNGHRIPKVSERIGLDGKKRATANRLQLEPASTDEGSSSKTNTLSGRKESAMPVELTEPIPPQPEKELTRQEIGELLRKALGYLERMHPVKCEVPLYLNAVATLQKIQAAVQMQLPGMPLAEKPRAKGTKAEVVAYCTTRGLTGADGEWFFDKNEGCGWKVAGKSIRDWQAVVRAWQAQTIFPSQKEALARSGGKPTSEDVALARMRATCEQVLRRTK